MQERHALKEIAKFAKREFREKRPKSVKVYRVKNERVFTKGFLSSISMSRERLSKYIVAVEHPETVRVYFFTKQGILFSGQNFDNTEKVRKEIKKNTTIQYRIPKVSS
jgi:hypothetical protein